MATQKNVHNFADRRTVTKLDEWKNRDTVETLADLLEKARKGEISGLLFSVRLGAKHHAMGAAGEYLSDPMMAVGIAARMQHRLHIMIDETA